MARFGLDYPTLREEAPSLIYASISGYGQTGPEAHKGGFDLIAQGVSGIMSVTGESGGPPVKAGVPVTDVGAGLLALSGILAALYHRTRSGRGQHVDTSLVEAGVAFSVWEASEYFLTGESPRPCGSAHRLIAPYQAIRCEDGYITVGTATDRLFSRFSQVLGHPEWVESTEFGSNAQRMNNTDMLIDQIESITKTAPRSHWLTLFEASGVPCGPINSYSEALTDPQILAREMVVDTTHPTLGPIKSLGTPIKLSETPLDPRRPAPLLGQHTDEILAEIGYDEEEISRLRGLGAVG
jgi:formyl-CoA transferase